MNKSELLQFLDEMWMDYLLLNPEAHQIHQLFSERNPEVVNDHIALRTFDLPAVNLQRIAQPFINAGYLCGGEYHFPAKNLYAQHFQHDDPELPKVFISQLLTQSLNEENQDLVNHLISHIDRNSLKDPGFCYSGRHWPLSYNQYKQLLQQSEYAAWVAAFGFRPNHFTILVNRLNSHTSIEEVNQFLQEQGFELNDAGGLVKGGPDEYLAQSSTRANKVQVSFSDQTAEIPSCYYEFALRYPLADGHLYQGFVAASADKIFESTDTR